VLKAYLLPLEPTDDQVDQFESHAGGTRYAYNWAIARIYANWDQRAAEASYGIPEAELTPWVSSNSIGLNNAFNAAKDEIAPWNRENSSRIYNTAFVNAARAFTNYRKQRKEGRRRDGRRVGAPRFKSKRGTPSFQFAAGVSLSGRRHVKMPKIGTVRLGRSSRRLARLVEAGKATIKTCTVSRRGSRWFISMLADIVSAPPPPRTRDRVVGVDMGLKVLVALSTGEVVDNPAHYETSLPRLRRAQRTMARRRGPDRRTRTVPSGRWRKASERVAKIAERTGNQRRNTLHQLSARLVREFDTIVVEDLAVRNMLGNHKLARRIAGASWAELRRQLAYKAEWTGATVVVANRWTPSSKACSGCGAVKAKLPLSVRTYRCDCGLVIDRDVNAARNLAALAVKTAATSDHVATGRQGREQPDGTACKPSLRLARHEAAQIATGRLCKA
jgi:putative transposase